MGDESANSSPHHSSAKGGCELTYLPSPFPGRQAGPSAKAAESRTKKSPGFLLGCPSYLPQTRTVIELAGPSSEDPARIPYAFPSLLSKSPRLGSFFASA